MKILSIVGARPQFIKAAMTTRALTKYRHVREFLLHTGQHYDTNMSQIFFAELSIPAPYKNLNVGSGTHGKQTSKMIVGIERECSRVFPDMILVYGDTNSTLAGALVGAQLHIPVAHVEAGIRSFNMAMPEEVNRIVADRLSTLLFAPTTTATQNLRKEGITKGVYRTGDVMIDAIYFTRDRVKNLTPARRKKLIPSEPYSVLTVHRQENTEDAKKLKQILQSFSASPIPVIFPIHPRTRKAIKKLRIRIPNQIRVIPPVSYLEMIALEKDAQAVWTDSGGMQKEAAVLQTPCYTLRKETEWVETVTKKWNRLVGANPVKIKRILKRSSKLSKLRPFPTRTFYGDGRAAEKIAAVIAKLR